MHPNHFLSIERINPVRTHRLFYFLFIFLFILTLPSQAQLKKRVAVSCFEDRSGGGYHSLGEGVADMLVTALVKSGKFMVIERKEIERVIQEQQFGESFMVTPETAPKVGQILGAELFILGGVSEFGQSESNISGGVSILGGGITSKKSRAVVDIRLVNTTTGEIVAAETEEGTESSTGISVRYEDIDFSNQNSWNDTDMGKAAREAINGCVKLISENMGKIPWSGKILKLNTDGTILMKPGSEGKVTPGMEFSVFHKGEEVKDPDTGLTLGSEETKIGRIVVVEDALKGKAARAKVLSGTGFQVGDIVRDKEK
jgi:curli biogenesis system outer membrane secretion channel CsgG